jgi:DNA-binding MarR family transcriptional regulator
LIEKDFALQMKDEEIRAAAYDLRRSITRMARRMRTLRANHGISGSKLSVLGHLYRMGRPMTASDLAHVERLQPQSLTRIIADLEKRGLIQRRPDDLDRRQVLIEISQAGLDLLITDARRQDTWLVAAMRRKLTPAEQSVLSVAAQLLDNLSDEDELEVSEDQPPPPNNPNESLT